MSFGVELLNNTGNVLVDATHRHAHLIAFGSAPAAFTVNTPGTVTFTAVSVPILFVKAPIGSIFCVIEVSESYFKYYCSAGSLEWRVYAAGTVMPPPTGHGIAVYASNGDLLFNSNEAIPTLSEVLTILTTADVYEGFVGLSGFTPMLNTPIKTMNFSAARNGGLPFVSASSFSYAQAQYGATYNAQSSAAGRFISDTQMEISKLLCTGGGSPLYPNTAYRIGSYPRAMLLIQ